MTQGSHAYAFEHGSEPRRPRPDPITDAALRSVARLIEDRADAIGTPQPVRRPPPTAAMEQALADQMHRHQLEHNELFHAYDCEQLVQRTISLREHSDQQRRRSRHATNVAILLVWFGFLTTVAAGAVSITWFVIHIGCSPSVWSLPSLGLASGGLVTFGSGVVAMSRRTRKRRSRVTRQDQAPPVSTVPQRRQSRPSETHTPDAREGPRAGKG
jgi:hypothetical protein